MAATEPMPLRVRQYEAGSALYQALLRAAPMKKH
jgi:hypothetical protein